MDIGQNPEKSSGNPNLDQEKCLKCDVIPCINFTAEEREYHGELTLLTKASYPPCAFGWVIYLLCRYSYFILKRGIRSKLQLLLHQGIRDLRAASFLFMAGRYRSGLQILRPVLENCIAGLYFEEGPKFARDDKERNEIEEDWKRFENGEFKWTATKLLKWLKKRGVIEQELKKFIENTKKRLNKYLHPSLPEMDHQKILEDICPACPASAYHDEEEFKECIETFQDVVAILLEVLNTYCLKILLHKELEEISAHLSKLKKMEEEIGEKIIFSKQLELFIHRFNFQ